MRRIQIAVLAAVMGLSAGAWAKGANTSGLNGGNARGAGSFGGSSSKGDVNSRDIGTFENDVTGMSGTEYRVSGNKYGTRGPGANPIQPEKGVSEGKPAAPSSGHTPTDQELARGVPTDLPDPGPIPRPQLGGQGAGM